MIDLLFRIIRVVVPTVIVLVIFMKMIEFWWAGELWQSRLARVPPQFGATSISYSNEKTCGAGFLPGDAESGVVIYPLPEHVLAHIKSQGLAYFGFLGPAWPTWRETPIAYDRKWTEPEPGRLSPDSRLERYLQRYSCFIEVEPELTRKIDEVIESPGSYYGYYRGHGAGGRTVIVSPRHKAAYLIYAG